MKYELWDMVAYGHDEPMVPFTLMATSDNYEEIYFKFNKMVKNKPCVIFLKEKEKNND